MMLNQGVAERVAAPDGLTEGNNFNAADKKSGKCRPENDDLSSLEEETDSVEKNAIKRTSVRQRPPGRKAPLANKRPLWADYRETAHKGLFLGVAPQIRGQYFVLLGGKMERLMSPLNSPEMFAELAGADPEIPSGEVAGDVRTALMRCWRRCVHRDKSRRMISTITIDDLVEIYLRQRGKCAITGMPFVLPEDREDKERRGPWSPSVDRVNNRYGYTVENIQLVTAMANVAKSDFSLKDFHRMCVHAAINQKLLGPRHE